MSIIDNFMQVYMYEFEIFLNTKVEEILKVSFQSDEANTDRPLKEFLKNIIERDFNCIPSNTKVKTIKYENQSLIDLSTIKKFRINRVLLPEEIDSNIKNIIKENKNAVYTNPDLCLEIIYLDNVYYETVELKSTKQDSIPGSSIQQILPNEWVIFIKHSKRNIEITTGKYIHAINSPMQFPDRSPRPQVSFHEMDSWNHTNRIFAYSSLVYKKDDLDVLKEKLIIDWQDVLAERWVKVIFDKNDISNKEPWFNTNLRKFILKFLKNYDSLNDEEKKELKKRLTFLVDTDR